MTALVHFLGLLSSITLAVTDLGELVFQDDFERSESQEKKDEPGKGWATNSYKRAQGDKQVDLRWYYANLYQPPGGSCSIRHPPL